VRNIGEYQKAEPLYIKALNISEKVLGEEHPNTLNIFNNFDKLGEEIKNKTNFLKLG